MEDKKPWQSKTILVMTLTGLLTTLAPFLPAAADIASYVNTHGVAVAQVMSVLGIWLRFVTKGRVKLEE